MNIAVAGTGYVGMSIATLLAQHNHVTAVDVIPEKVEKINNRISPIQDEYIEKYLAEKELDLTATLDGEAAYSNADFVVIAAPTNYDPQKNFFDTSHVEEVIDLVLKVNPDAVMVIKSTIPVGYTRSLYVKYAARGYKKFNLLFSPEFLRESKALYDNLYPSRIIVGIPKVMSEEFAEENAAISSLTDLDWLTEKAHTFAQLLQEGAIKQEVPTLFMGMKEAEAVEVFAHFRIGLQYCENCRAKLSFQIMSAYLTRMCALVDACSRHDGKWSHTDVRCIASGIVESGEVGCSNNKVDRVDQSDSWNTHDQLKITPYVLVHGNDRPDFLLDLSDSGRKSLDCSVDARVSVFCRKQAPL